MTNHVHDISLMVRRRFGPANVSMALNAAAAAYNYGRRAVGTVRRVGQVAQRFTRNFASRRRFSTYRYRRPVPRFRRRRRTRFRRKLYRRKIRGIPNIPRRNVYTRRRKGMRRGNTGILALQKRIQSGHTLPTQTFVRMYFRGSGLVSFNNTASSVGRTGSLNRLNRGPISGSVSTQNTTTTGSIFGHIMYKEFWDMLYEEYLVLGATMRIKINPLVYPGTLVGSVPANQEGSTHIPEGSQPGYWYVRVSYIRNTDGSNYEQVGHSIQNEGATNDERLWAHERDFLADPTVSWKKDTTRRKTKVIRTNLHQGISGSSVRVSETGVTADGDYSVSHETEMSTRPVYLRVNFSAKKHMMVKDPLNELSWHTFAQGPISIADFRFRVGYIGFTGDGVSSYHVPLDRVQDKEVTYDAKYFVALRGPKINPNMYTDMEELAKIEARRKRPIVEEEESDDEDSEFEELANEFDTSLENAEGGMH